jgi:putative molybdopterin biosynthesis protein
MTHEQQQFLEVVDVDEATRLWWEIINQIQLSTEEIDLDCALGRVLAEDLISTVDVPGFDRSNVDGYAVIAADTYEAAESDRRELQLTGEIIHPGILPSIEITSGFATPIATGGMIPRGADAVVMLEQTILLENCLQITKPVVPGMHISHAGTDMARGELVLTARAHLTPRETGLMAAIGRDRITVFRRPEIAIISTGNEIVAPGKPCPPGRTFDSNSRILADSVTEAGGKPVFHGIVGDDPAEMRMAIVNAIQSADMVILSGGTSKGAGDISYRALAELSPGIIVHGVALKPGKPICLGASGKTPIAILPGFPTSAIFTFHEFIDPVIRHLSGRKRIQKQSLHARLANRVNSERGRTEFLLVSLVPSGNDLAAYPMGKGSGSVTTFSRADGFITIGKHQEFVSANETVTVTTYGREIKPADLVIIGSHCTGLDEIISQLSARGLVIKSMSVGSQGGLDAASRSECDIAGCHLLDIATDQYNLPFLTPQLKLLFGYGRMQGLVFRHDDRRFENRTPEEIIEIACDEARMVSRNRGSGTRVIIDQLLKGRKPAGYSVEVRSHHAVAAAITQNRADWGMTIEPVARAYGLQFVPVREESYDFMIPEARAGRPEVILFQQLLASFELQSKLKSMGFLIRTETGRWAD